MCEPDLTVFLSFSHMIYQAYSNIFAPVCDRDFRFINFRRTGSMQNFTVRHIIINEIIHRQHIQYLFYLNIVKIPNLSCRSFLQHKYSGNGTDHCRCHALKNRIFHSRASLAYFYNCIIAHIPKKWNRKNTPTALSRCISQ